MRTIDKILQEYGESHRNRTNKMIHWICVPLIFFSILGMLSTILPSIKSSLNFGLINIIVCPLITLYYWRLSPRLALGMVPVMMLFLSVIHYHHHSPYKFWYYLAIFIISWIFQFVGHQIEGKKPSFIKDIQFLLIGPLWLLSHIYKGFNIAY